MDIARHRAGAVIRGRCAPKSGACHRGRPCVHSSTTAAPAGYDRQASMTRRSTVGPVHRRWWEALLAALLLAALVQRPALDGMLFDDDYAQLGFLAGFEHPDFHPRHRLDLYDFGAVAFFRPLTSALMN